MAQSTDIDVADVGRVTCAGVAAYLAVHFIIMPQLTELGFSFPATFYFGAASMAVLSIAVSVLLAPRGLSAEPATVVSAE